jgi:Type II secretion system (T2SS), protein G
MAAKKALGLVPLVLGTLVLVALCSVLTPVLAWTGLVLQEQQDALLQSAREQEALEQEALERQELERQERERKAVEEKPYLECRNRLQQLTAVVETYKLNNGEYPPTLDTLLQPQPRGGPAFYGEAGALLDPWGKPFHYDAAGLHQGGRRPDIWSDSPKGPLGNWPLQPNENRS